MNSTRNTGAPAYCGMSSSSSLAMSISSSTCPLPIMSSIFSTYTRTKRATRLASGTPAHTKTGGNVVNWRHATHVFVLPHDLQPVVCEIFYSFSIKHAFGNDLRSGTHQKAHKMCHKHRATSRDGKRGDERGSCATTTGNGPARPAASFRTVR
jgi:hypothetical protein